MERQVLFEGSDETLETGALLLHDILLDREVRMMSELEIDGPTIDRIIGMIAKNRIEMLRKLGIVARVENASWQKLIEEKSADFPSS